MIFPFVPSMPNPDGLVAKNVKQIFLKVHWGLLLFFRYYSKNLFWRLFLTVIISDRFLNFSQLNLTVKWHPGITLIVSLRDKDPRQLVTLSILIFFAGRTKKKLMKSWKVSLTLQSFHDSWHSSINLLLQGIREGTIAEVPTKKGRGKGKTEKVAEQYSDFVVEYAKSSRAACRGCLEKIAKVNCKNLICQLHC